MEKFGNEEKNSYSIVDGRSISEQIATIERNGAFETAHVARRQLLQALGMPEAPKAADKVLSFGCFVPYNSPDYVRDAMALLKKLNIDYIPLAEAKCCGYPIMEQDLENNMSYGCNFLKWNTEIAKGYGANTMMYCCVACAYAATHAQAANHFTEPVAHRYVLDVMIDALSTCEDLEFQNDKTGRPVKAAYFHGCHGWYRFSSPQGYVPHENYRLFVEKIRNVEIADFKKGLCCKRSVEKIEEAVRATDADILICPCNECYRRMKELEKSFGIPVMSYPEFLLHCIR